MKQENLLSDQRRATNLESDTMNNSLEEVSLYTDSPPKKEDLAVCANTAKYPSFYLLAK